MFTFDPTIPLNATFLDDLTTLCSQDVNVMKTKLDSASGRNQTPPAVNMGAAGTSTLSEPVRRHKAAVCSWYHSYSTTTTVTVLYLK